MVRSLIPGDQPRDRKTGKMAPKPGSASHPGMVGQTSGRVRRPVTPNVGTATVLTGRRPPRTPQPSEPNDALRHFARTLAKRHGRAYDESTPEGREALERAATRLGRYATYDDLRDIETMDLTELRRRANAAAAIRHDIEDAGGDPGEARTPYFYGGD